jgi:hypothetical protein
LMSPTLSTKSRYALPAWALLRRSARRRRAAGERWAVRAASVGSSDPPSPARLGVARCPRTGR